MKLLALLLVWCMLVPAARAEEDVLFTVRPLVDMTATAVMLTGEGIHPDAMMSSELTACLLAAGMQQGRIGTAFDVQNAAWRESFLTHAYAPAHGAVEGEIMLPESYAYYGVRPMMLDESGDGNAVRILGDVYQAADMLEELSHDQYAQVKWLDRRAVVELRRHDDAPGGWQLYSFSLDAEWEMEQAAQDYFTQTMAEYMNASLGYAIQYPAVFGEHVQETDTGIRAELPDALFDVSCLPNDKGWTTESLLASIKQESPGAETNMNSITGCARAVVVADKEIQVTVFMVTDEHIYQAHLYYDPTLSKDFSLYSDYMMNSFTVDELGQG